MKFTFVSEYPKAYTAKQTVTYNRLVILNMLNMIRHVINLSKLSS